LPLQSSQRPPFRPPQLPLMGRRPLITPIAIAAITARIIAKLMISVVISVIH
jgi:hypothetical protein